MNTINYNESHIFDEPELSKQMVAISEALRNPYQVIPDSIIEELVNELKTADVR
ncbi:hypothetical protein [Brucella tritici]|uniref:hypothetical protein n=1 Tax=Brucella tritici TaxID=94626 RepID=UPI00178C4D75|nr:hypothetical protein [Brucella tritici]